MAKKDITYKEAISEVEDIIEKIEKEELDVDELTKNVKRVSQLIKICRSKLNDTEAEVEKIINEIDEI